MNRYRLLIAVAAAVAGLLLGHDLVGASKCDPATNPCNNHVYLPVAWRPTAPTVTPTPLPLRDPYEVGNRCRESEIWHYLELNRDYYATVYGYYDQDYFQTVTLVPGKHYRIEMWPPEKQDYDMDLWLAESRTTCSLFTTGGSGGLNAGEGVPESIPDFGSTFEVSDEMSLIVRVFSPYPTAYHDPHHYYRLRLSECGRPIPGSTSTPTPVP